MPPPIDTPTRWTGAMPSASTSPAQSSPSCQPPYDGDPGSPVVDSPVSRWSYRTTCRPAADRRVQSSASHQSIAAAAPATSSSVGSPGSPKLSTHSSTSPTRTCRRSAMPSPSQTPPTASTPPTALPETPVRPGVTFVGDDALCHQCPIHTQKGDTGTDGNSSTATAAPGQQPLPTRSRADDRAV